jgi:hypothetical protein
MRPGSGRKRPIRGKCERQLTKSPRISATASHSPLHLASCPREGPLCNSHGHCIPGEHGQIENEERQAARQGRSAARAGRMDPMVGRLACVSAAGHRRALLLRRRPPGQSLGARGRSEPHTRHSTEADHLGTVSGDWPTRRPGACRTAGHGGGLRGSGLPDRRLRAFSCSRVCLVAGGACAGGENRDFAQESPSVLGRDTAGKARNMIGELVRRALASNHASAHQGSERSLTTPPWRQVGRSLHQPRTPHRENAKSALSAG